jgi:PIN domain nuclease of toxin-antitoxin system
VRLLDAYALIALFAGEPALPEVKEVIGGGGAAITAINLAETIDVCMRTHDLAEAELNDAVSTLTGTGRLDVLDLDDAAAWRAASIRAEHYRRRTSELSLADCFLLASAAPGEDAIATADPPVAEVARALGIELIALSDCAGRRP